MKTNSVVQLEFEKEFLNDIDIVLKPREEQFVQYYLQYHSYTKAYALLRPNLKCSQKTLWEASSKYVKRNPGIVKRIAQLQRQAAEKIAKDGLLTATQALLIISSLAKNAQKEDVKLRAAETFLDYISKNMEKENNQQRIVFMPFNKKQTKKMDEFIDGVINDVPEKKNER